jgi:hypothetical protein
MVVPGGGISPEGKHWVPSRKAFLLPVRVLGKLFRRLFLAKLLQLHDAGRLAFFGSMAQLADSRVFLRHLGPVRQKRWVVYTKAPFAGPEAVFGTIRNFVCEVIMMRMKGTSLWLSRKKYWTSYWLVAIPRICLPRTAWSTS